jgi:hypothetical protein
VKIGLFTDAICRLWLNDGAAWRVGRGYSPPPQSSKT